MKDHLAHGGVDHQKRVLVADDDVDVCTLLQLVLAPFGAVTTVHDAEAALTILDSEPAFDVIVSDFNLPGINGLEFVERVRHGVRGSGTPILMISGQGAFNVGERARAAGVDLFLDKPLPSVNSVRQSPHYCSRACDTLRPETGARFCRRSLA